MTKEEAPPSADEYLEQIGKYNLPPDVVQELERFRRTGPIGIEHYLLPKYVEGLSPDERELAYIKSMFQLPGIRTKGARDPVIDGLKRRARDLIKVVAPERVQQIVEPPILKFIEEE